jgi:hypothetical protein
VTAAVDTSMLASSVVSKLLRDGHAVTSDPRRLARACVDMARLLDDLGVRHVDDAVGGQFLACIVAADRCRRGRRAPAQKEAALCPPPRLRVVS